MPSSSCNVYQTLLPTEEIITLSTTTVTPLYSSSKLVLMGTVIPHPDNVGTIEIGYAASPQNVQSLNLLFAGRSFRYNLADVKVQATDAGDKVIVISTPYPYN
jgi:hypothetical protein